MDSPPSFTLFLFFFFFFSLFVSPSLSDPRATTAALVCPNRTSATSDRQSFIANFLSAMDAVTPQIARQRFARVVTGAGNDTVYAFGECMKDLSQNDYNLCYAQSKTEILKCLPFQRATRGGEIFLDGCYLRYDDYEFFGEALSLEDRIVCGNNSFNGNRTAFRANAIKLVRNLSVEAPKNDGFFVGFVDQGNSTIYGLSQCWEFVNESSCSSCLENAVSRIGSCLPNDEGRVLSAGCYLRYSGVRFYNDSGSDATGDGGGRHLAVILASTSSALAAVMVVATAIYFGKRKLTRRRQERKQLGALADTVNKSELNFKYETLERATNYFDNSNKLGQGGSGSVYKGILPDGKAVAVKRLFFTTRQWVDQFFNEVNLISGLHHKNLVKLLGCSITGPESLLVYEYVPNHSLHDYLFGDRKNTRQLSWEVRYNIIVGTAEGLTYLHEESKLRIIHRDIKLSNILLDENFTTKIADFGLARLFPEDQTHLSTMIAGTLGYMAPEYVVRGKLTEKADVYSFGVLVIEIVCGKRNNAFSQDSFSILQKVWNLYGTGRLSEAVDPKLVGRFHEEEASRVLQIGLLCTQASAELRPSMSMVVKMLTDNHDIPCPAQPPFLNSTNVGSSSFPPGINNSQPESGTQSSANNDTDNWIEPR